MAARTNNPVVLVIEDDPDVRALLKDVLNEIDYEVITVHDARAALQLMRSIRIDLITLDLDLPGLPGSEFLRLLRERTVQSPPVIIITSDTPVSRQLQEQVQAIAAKPFDVDDLLTTIRELLPTDRHVS